MATDNPEKLVLTVAEARQILRIGKSTAYAAVRNGELRAFRIGRRWLVPASAVQRLLDSQGEGR